MFRAKKSLSQNFLKDRNICKKILKYTNIKNNIILEIGAGYGFMTDYIIKEKPKKLLLIEKDFNLTKYLQHKYKENNNIEIICEDILNYNLSNFKNLVVIANLPYNVSTKIILYLFKFNKNIFEMVLMLQKEVALKFDYNLRNMNKYKFLTKIVSDFTICFDVSKNVFFPKPKVKSSVVKFNFKKQQVDLQKADLFSKLIFKNVRKKINNNLKLKKKNSLVDKRVNELSINELLKIYYLF